MILTAAQTVFGTTDADSDRQFRALYRALKTCNSAVLAASLAAEPVPDIAMRTKAFGRAMLLPACKEATLLLARRGIRADAPLPDGSNALVRAIAGRRWELMETLLRQGADIHGTGSTGVGVLHAAALTGDAALIERFVAAGVEVDARSYMGSTPLHYAADSRHGLDAVKVLLAHGAAVDMANNVGVTALMRAVADNNEAIVRVLLPAGARREAADTDGKTALVRAVSCGLPEIVRLLLDGCGMCAGQRVDEAVNLALERRATEVLMALGATAPGVAALARHKNEFLRLAALQNDDAALMLALSLRPDIDASEKGGRTALFHALDNGNAAMARRLLELGADPRLVDASGDPAIVVAAEKRLAELMPFLIARGGDPLAPGSRRKSALGIAAGQGDRDMVAAILAGIPNPAGHRKDLTKALAAAVEKGQAEAATLLLEAGADPTASGYVYPFLIKAASLGSVDLCRLLVAHGAARSDENARLALIYAVEDGRVDVVRWMLDNGWQADGGAQSASSGGQEAPDNTPLFFAANKGQLEIARLLLAHGANVEAPQYLRNTVLGAAVESGKVELVRVLLAAGADPNRRFLGVKTADSPVTPLMAAAATGSAALVRTLLDNGADPERRNGLGQTALHYARDLAVVRLLLAAGADADVVDRAGASPLVHAVADWDVERAEALLRAGAHPERGYLRLRGGSFVSPLWIAANAIAPDHKEARTDALVRLLLNYCPDADAFASPRALPSPPVWLKPQLAELTPRYADPGGRAMTMMDDGTLFSAWPVLSGNRTCLRTRRLRRGEAPAAIERIFCGDSTYVQRVIVASGGGRATVAWSGTENGQPKIWLRRWQVAGGWSKQSSLALPTPDGIALDIAVDAGGGTTVFFLAGKLGVFEGGYCAADADCRRIDDFPVAAGGRILHWEVIPLPDGRILMLWTQRRVLNGDEDTVLMAARFSQGMRVGEPDQVAAHLATGGFSATAAATGAAVAWLEGWEEGVSLRVRRLDGKRGWQPAAELRDQAIQPHSLQLTADADDGLVLVWGEDYQSGTQLWISRESGGRWRAPKSLDDAVSYHTAYRPALHVDEDGVATVCWLQGSPLGGDRSLWARDFGPDGAWGKSYPVPGPADGIDDYWFVGNGRDAALVVRTSNLDAGKLVVTDTAGNVERTMDPVTHEAEETNTFVLWRLERSTK